MPLGIPQIIDPVYWIVEDSRVLYMSGYNDNIISNVPLENGEYYLPKPFTPDSFMSKIREILL